MIYKRFDNGGKLDNSETTYSGGILPAVNGNTFHPPLFVPTENPIAINPMQLMELAQRQIQQKNEISNKIKLIQNSFVSDNTFMKMPNYNQFQYYNESDSISDKIKKNNMKLERSKHHPVEDSFNEYVIEKGDTLYKLANKYNTSIKQIAKDNNIKDVDKIYIGQKLKIHQNNNNQQTGFQNLYEGIKDIPTIYKIDETINKLGNEQVIMNAKHDDNYVIVKKGDDDTRYFNVYNKNNKLLFSTNRISTGINPHDYNTTMKFDEKGNVAYGEGNMSTPAGVTRISSVGTYNGKPSFQRERYNIYNNKDGKKNEYEDIASSIHQGTVDKGRKSNGCIRMNGDDLETLSKYIKKGTMIYTLPEDDNSRFSLKEGKIFYSAENAIGDPNSYDDDYNTYSKKDYEPLTIKKKITNANNRDLIQLIKEFAPLQLARNMAADLEKIRNINEDVFMKTISNKKEEFQKKFNIDSKTYNQIAMIAMGIAKQETDFNIAPSKLAKNAADAFDKRPFLKKLINGESEAESNNLSFGISQIKMRGDNDGMQKLYKEYDIDEHSIDNPDKGAIATLIRLLYMYNSEVRGKNFIDMDNNKMDITDVLLYKWLGKNHLLKNKEAEPYKNKYIRRVKKYSNEYYYLKE